MENILHHVVVIYIAQIILEVCLLGMDDLGGLAEQAQRHKQAYHAVVPLVASSPSQGSQWQGSAHPLSLLLVRDCPCASPMCFAIWRTGGMVRPRNVLSDDKQVDRSGLSRLMIG